MAIDLATAIRGAAEAAQACVVDGLPEQADRTAVPLVRLEEEDAVRLISAARPKAVYLVEVAFDPDGEIAAATEALADRGVEKQPASLTAAHRRVAGHAGEIRTTLAGFMVDGVLHTSSASAAWHDAFDEVVDEVLDAAREDAQAHGRAEAKVANAEIAAKAAILAAHPSFNFSRVSFEKRLTLAAALFGDAEEDHLHEITRRAENLFWLEQSGFKAPA
ncbi:hypothetical protein [Phenylobacterium ferrooxidans]|uniref:Uncharacterized protein n=1 Tax=Phenylobacterium ferrooxidans TaxID=2982689 RepID=A0ABW6CWV9_9CAUL